MATNKLERTYTIPLRSDFVRVPRYYRAKRAINRIKNYISKHMKSEDVRIGSVLNEHVWARGIKNPPGKVTVKAIREADFVTVELEGHVYKVQSVQTEKTEAPTSFKDKLAAKLQKKDDSDDKGEEESKAPVKESTSKKSAESSADKSEPVEESSKDADVVKDDSVKSSKSEDSVNKK